MSYEYDTGFFNYIEEGSLRSANAFVCEVLAWMSPESVLDVGCGRGAWLAVWREAGVTDIHGVDGEYVDQSKLLIPQDSFIVADLTEPLNLGRRYGLAQSLEVAEHLPPEAAEGFIDSLCRHADMILFSAAVNGQGGENHLNERPLEYWRQIFAARGFEPFDALRPQLRDRRDVEPWYRYNTVLYANEAGRSALPESVLVTGVPSTRPLRENGDFLWRVRRAVVRCLPQVVATYIARVNGRFQARRANAASNAD